MNQVRREQPQANPTLSDAELRAAIYFAVGVTSESGNRAYRLVVAGDRASTPRLEPADNSCRRSRRTAGWRALRHRPPPTVPLDVS